MKFFCLFFSLLLSTLCMQAQMLHNHSAHGYCQLHKNMGAQGSTLNDPSNLRSDTLDVLSYTINLDMTLMNSQQISASCSILFSSKMNGIDWINLDLLALTVDSVTSEVGVLPFAHTGALVQVQLPMLLNMGDQYTIVVHYHGSPENDTQWGGFYFSSGYAYNMGVGFVANPHNFGRVWFPCFDNFVERSAYSVNVLTNNNRTAYCGGVRTAVDTVGTDSLLTHWELTNEIPSYLASVAVATYTHAESSFESIASTQVPIYLAAKAVDTTNMKQSMVNLVPWLHGLEAHYGPYRWPRVGFTAVPFNGGAMEHATNIAYPLFAVDGSLAYETLYAHELSHHWWGDLVTCRNEGDMWINEGWASFSEALFKEVIYGQQAYIDYVKDNHKDVLLHAHQDDGARYPVSPVPHEITYGSHVYLKGADMAHTLRGYMGDEDFFTAIKDFLNEYQFSDVSSEDLRDYFQQYTSANLTSFFDNWIFAQGFPEFRVVNAVSQGNNNWQVNVEQHSHYAPALYENVPMQLTAINELGQKFSTYILASGESTSTIVSLPTDFAPIGFCVNDNDALSMVVLAEEQWITETGSNDFDYAEMDMDTDSLGAMDSIFVRVENHFGAVDENQSQVEYFISPDRWWNVITNADNDAIINAEIRFYGNQNQTNYFDSLFFQYVIENELTEDSLILLYRANGTAQWQPFDTYTLSTLGGNTNWSGRFNISHLKQGQYAWAAPTGMVNVDHISQNKAQIFLSGYDINILANQLKGDVNIYDASGKLIWSGKFQNSLQVPTTSWQTGIYTVKCILENSMVYTKKLVIAK